MKHAGSFAVAAVPASEERLSGRQAELAKIEAEFDGAASQRTFKVLVIRGAAGVGRTALLNAAAQRLTQRGAWVVRSQLSRPRCQPFELVQSLSTACLDRIRPAYPSEVVKGITARLAPVLGTPQVAESGESPSSVLAELVSMSARDVPALLIIDDLDAADPASISAVRHLVNVLTVPPAIRSAEEPLAGGLLLVSVRDDSNSAELESVVGTWPSLSLPALDLDGVRQYLSRTDAARRAFEITGGVPGRLDALLNSDEPIDFVARRFERLAASELSVLRAIAAVGEPVDAEFVAAVSGRRDAGVKLTRLVAARLAQASPVAGKSLYSLARESDRIALLDGLAADELSALHERAGRLFEARGDAEAAFEQFVACGDEQRAARSGLAAASRLAERLAWANAEAVLTRLLALNLSADDRGAALLELAKTRERQGDIRGALAAIGRARARLPGSRGAELRARSSRLCVVLGAAKAAERLSRRVLQSEPVASVRADAWVALTEARFLRGAYEEAIKLSGEGKALPIEHQLVLGNVRGKALLMLTRLEEARDAFRANAELALQAKIAVEHSRALLNVGVVAHRQGLREEARGAYRAALTAEARSPLAAIVHANLSSLALEEGEAEEALSQAHRALSAFARDGRIKEQAHASQNLALIYLYLGDALRAGEVAQHAESLATRIGDPYLIAGARVVGANARFVHGDHDAAQKIAAVADEFQRLGNKRYYREALLLLALARVASQEYADARAVLDRASKDGALSVPALAAEWYLLDAELHFAQGAIDACATSLMEARSALVAAPQLELPARLYFLQGEVAERRGDSTLAQAERLRAARIIDELASKVPPERRAMFLARRSRRVILEAVGRAWTPVSTPSQRAVEIPVSAPSTSPSMLIGGSPSIVRLNGLINRLGPSMATVLLRGESGTGKELAARAIHACSSRKSLPLVAVNCGALSEELLLSELFGHERGAFTGAVREKKGRFELADGGTIFLDEVGDISPRAQVALLRVLQERTFERVGGTRTISVDVRVICATNRNLEDLIERGLFREDLYYRLRGATLTLPPLRERLDDLPVLCEHFFARHARESGLPPRTLSPEAKRLVSRYRWPGNVRELLNVLESALVMSVGQTIGPEAFELFPELFDSESVAETPRAAVVPLVEQAAAPEAPSESGLLDFYQILKNRDLSLKDFRRELDVACISRALVDGNGNISEAARLLKMKRSRLSQIVNAEPELRALCHGGLVLSAAGDLDD